MDGLPKYHIFVWRWWIIPKTKLAEVASLWCCLLLFFLALRLDLCDGWWAARINVAHIRGSLWKTPACGINHCSSSTAKGEESSFTSDPKAWTQSALELFDFGPLGSLADWSLGSLGCNLSHQRLVCATGWACQEPRPECTAHSSGG